MEEKQMDLVLEAIAVASDVDDDETLNDWSTLCLEMSHPSAGLAVVNGYSNEAFVSETERPSTSADRQRPVVSGPEPAARSPSSSYSSSCSSLAAPRHGQPAGPRRNDLTMVYAIFSTVCFCPLIGVAAWLAACRSAECLDEGDGLLAARRARLSRRLSFTSIGVGSLLVMSSIVMVVVFARSIILPVLLIVAFWLLLVNYFVFEVIL